MSIGPWQIIIVVLIILLLFGAGRLSEIGKGLGEGIKNFKKGIASDDDDDDAGDERLAKKKKKEPKQLPAKGRSSVEEERQRSKHDEES
jgi:sec-independent protein translocase protein TatA